MKKLIKIFLTFLKISSFTFGGGYAVLPLLKSEAVDNQKWLSDSELSNIFALSQLVPGLIYVSSATFIGYKVGGILGAAAATIAVLIPSAAAILLISLLINNYFENPIIQKAFTGIICGVTVLTITVFKDMVKSNLKDFSTIFIFVISFILIEFFKVQAIVIIAAAVLLVIFYSIFIYLRAKNV